MSLARVWIRWKRRTSAQSAVIAQIEAEGYSVHFLMPEDDTETPRLLGPISGVVDTSRKKVKIRANQSQRAITEVLLAELERVRNRQP